MNPDQVAHIVRHIVTPFDVLQSALILWNLFASTAALVMLWRHLRDHKRWRETEAPEHRHTGALH